MDPTRCAARSSVSWHYCDRRGASDTTLDGLSLPLLLQLFRVASARAPFFATWRSFQPREFASTTHRGRNCSPRRRGPSSEISEKRVTAEEEGKSETERTFFFRTHCAYDTLSRVFLFVGERATRWKPSPEETVSSLSRES